MSARTVVIVDVADRPAAERMLDAVGELGPGSVLHGGAVVHRSEEGHLDVGRTVGDVPTGREPEHPRLTALVTLVVGAVDTLVLGNSLMAAGSPAVSPGDPVVEVLARSIEPGGIAVVAELTEADPSVVDRLVASAGGTLARYPADELESGAATDESAR